MQTIKGKGIRRAFVLYFIIWNYDFVLLLIGKKAIVDAISGYYQTANISLAQMFSECIQIESPWAFLFINKILMPFFLSFTIPNFLTLIDVLFQNLKSKFQNFHQKYTPDDRILEGGRIDSEDSKQDSSEKV